MNKRMLPIIIGALTVILILITAAGCTGADGDNPVSDTVQTTEAPAEPGFILSDGSVCAAVVVSRPASNAEFDAADDIAAALREKTGFNPELRDTAKDGAFEIIIGYSAYAYDSERFDMLEYGQWSVARSGDKLLVVGSDSSSLTAAVKYLVRHISEAETGADGRTELSYGTLCTIETHKQLPVDIPLASGRAAAYIQDVGGSGGKSKQATTFLMEESDYTAYCEKLTRMLYTLEAENRIGGNLFSTFVGNGNMLTVSFLPESGYLRIIAEPAYDVPLWEKLSGGERTSAVTVMQVERGADKNLAHPGGNVIKLADGRFVLYDVGYASTADQMVEYMRGVNTAADGKIHIAAVIISHPHPDHMGGMAQLANKYSSEVVLEALCINFIAASQQSVLSASSLASRQNEVETAAKKLGGTVYYVRAGQKFTVAGTVFEFLFTPDELGDYFLSGKDAAGNDSTAYDMNNSCVFMRVTESEQKVLFVGDSRGGESAMVAKMYKTALKCDIMQVAHHSYNVSESVAMYTYGRPSVLLWPAHTDEVDYTRYFTKTLLAATYVREHFYEDTQAVLTLPYTAK